MDRSFQSSGVPRTPITSTKYRPMSSASKRTLLPGMKKSSRFSTSGRSTQSLQVIAKTPYHIVESFGTPLPVIITESLTFADRNVLVSARISDSGYAWMVCGRRLLIWQYKQIDFNVKNSAHCYELTLPQSDLVHRADLVCIMQPDNTSNLTPPACLAVSPEGIARYWPSISHEGVSIEQSIELQGQECDSITYVEKIGCILATTTCSVVLLTPNRRSIVYRTLKPPAGWLGGISRKLSSLIFGPMSTSHSQETRLVKVAASFQNEEWHIYVLAGHSLQQWVIDPTKSTEYLNYECDVGRLVRETFHMKLWETGATGDSPADLDIWLLDIVPQSTELVLLAAAVNTQKSPQTHYALVYLSVSSSEAPTNLLSFFLLKLNGFYREDYEQEVLGYHLLLSNNHAYLYNNRSITALGYIPSTNINEPDTIEFSHSDDKILGGSICVNAPLFFTRNHGLVTLSNHDFNLQDTFNTSVAVSEGVSTPNMSFVDGNESNAGSLTLYDLNPNEVKTQQPDNVGHLKAAFIYYLKKNRVDCEEILNKIFPITGENDVDTPLDTAVVTTSKELVNDIPASDPRWSHQRSYRASLGSSSSMQIIRQLQDKQKALDSFISFLKETKIWDRLSKVTLRGIIMPTSFVLAEHAEKIVAAIALKNLNGSYNELLEESLSLALESEGLEQSESLTTQDLFYRSVTKVQHCIQQLAEICMKKANSDMNPTELASLIKMANEIILTVLQEVITYRQRKADTMVNRKSFQCEYLPWTAAQGNQGLYNALFTMYQLTLKYGAHQNTIDTEFSNSLYEQVVNIIDLMLDGKKCHLESVRGTPKFSLMLQQYELERHNLIKSLFDDKQYEKAAILAEKYCDFLTLVMLCDITDNQERLEEYIERFSAFNFSEFVFNWYIRENKQARLLTKFKNVTNKHATTLTHLINDYPTLSWLHNIFSGNCEQASNVLRNLAQKETEYVSRKKSMLSLSKLAKLAAPDTDVESINDINMALNLIAHQEDIPDVVMADHGFDVQNQRVLTPIELINLYISEDNNLSTYFEFKKALDLLFYINDDLEKSDLAHKIWCVAILKDRDLWLKLDTNAAVESVLETVFFKVVEEALIMNDDLNQFMPSLDRLLEAPELESLNKIPTFQFLLKAGYERVYKG